MAGFKGGFGGGNMQAMMKQAQMMQQKLADAQKELEEMEIEGESGGGMVKVVCNGKKVISSISIDPKAVDPDDVEMLEDLITTAFNEASKKADEMVQKGMSEVTGGLGLPGGMF